MQPQLEKARNSLMSADRRGAASPAVWLALVLVAFSLFRAWNYGITTAAGWDFYQFWAVALAAPEPATGNVYSTEARTRLGRTFYDRAFAPGGSDRQRASAKVRQVLETYSSPFLYTSFRLFSSGDYEADFRSYILTCVLCSAIGIFALCNAFRFSLLTSLMAVAAFLCGYEPLLTDLRVGNVNQLQLLALGLYIWFRSRSGLRYRHVIAGFVLGLGVMFKPNLLFVAGLLTIGWLIRRRYRILVEQYTGAVAASAVAVIVSSAYFRSLRIWFDWLGALKHLPDNITTIEMGNYSLNRLLSDVTGLNPGSFLAVALLGITVFFIWSGRRGRIRGRPRNTDAGDGFLEDALLLGLGCLVYLISGRLVWMHYLVLAIPMALYLLRPRAAEKPGTAPGILPYSLTTVTILLFGLTPFASGTLGAKGLALVLSAGLVVLYGLGIREVARPQDGPGTAENP